jgi:type IV pilus assembly protein PilE
MTRAELPRPPHIAGVTLIELLVALAIVAIVCAVAYPSYQRHVARTHRNAAAACLYLHAQYMERFFTTNLTYMDAVPVVACRRENGMDQRYTFAVTISGDGRGFVARATPIGAQASLDAACGTLSLDHAGIREPRNGCW